MTYDYPVIAILAGALLTYVIATGVGTLLVRAGFPLVSSGRRIGCIDGLRGYLALSVLLHHFIIWMQVTRLGGAWSAPSLNLFNNVGAGGVALFFMTTGLVFYPQVLGGMRAMSWPTLYVTRAFRILPLIAVSLAIITAIIMRETGRLPDGQYPAAAVQWLTSWGQPPLLGYADSWRMDAGVLWSLWYEWLFYLLVLPACVLGRDLVRGRLPSWVLPALVLATTLALRQIPSLDYGMMTYLPLFTIGMLAFECQRSDACRRVFKSRAMTVVALACLAGGMLSAPTPYGLAQLPLYGVFFTSVACGNDLAGTLRMKGALLLGECSYGIYLLHGIALSLLFTEGAAGIGRLATGKLPLLLPFVATLVIAAAAATYLLVERPAIRAGRAIARRGFGQTVRPDDQVLEIAP